ncbi:hypothetical protein ABL851_09605 [Variovorax sp. NFACC26]
MSPPCAWTTSRTHAATASASVTSTCRYTTRAPSASSCRSCSSFSAPSTERPVSTSVTSDTAVAIALPKINPRPPAPPLIRYTPPRFHGVGTNACACSASSRTSSRRITSRVAAR